MLIATIYKFYGQHIFRDANKTNRLKMMEARSYWPPSFGRLADIAATRLRTHLYKIILKEIT